MTPEMEKHMKTYFGLSRKKMIVNNFIAGLSWGLGSAIGATVVFAALGAILNHFGVFDSFKYFSQQVQSIPGALPK